MILYNDCCALGDEAWQNPSLGMNNLRRFLWLNRFHTHLDWSNLKQLVHNTPSLTLTLISNARFLPNMLAIAYFIMRQPF